jgi:hypothetical protein
MTLGLGWKKGITVNMTTLGASDYDGKDGD